MDYWGVGTTPVNDKQQPTETGGINGGKIVQKDTEGNVIGLWQSAR